MPPEWVKCPKRINHYTPNLVRESQLPFNDLIACLGREGVLLVLVGGNWWEQGERECTDRTGCQVARVCQLSGDPAGQGVLLHFLAWLYTAVVIKVTLLTNACIHFFLCHYYGYSKLFTTSGFSRNLIALIGAYSCISWVFCLVSMVNKLKFVTFPSSHVLIFYLNVDIIANIHISVEPPLSMIWK